MDTVHVYKDEAGEYRWRRKAPNGEEVANSGEGYESRASALDAAEREAGTEARVVDDTGEGNPSD